MASENLRKPKIFGSKNFSENVPENFFTFFHKFIFPGDSVVKNLPAMQEIQVRSHGWEDPLEKEVAAHSGILAWEIPGTEEPGGLQSMGVTKSQTQLSN